MEYQLQLKPFERKEGFKYKLIGLTDITLHTARHNPTISLFDRIKRSFTFKKPGRIFRPIESPAISGNFINALEELKRDPNFIQMVREEEANGYKILVGFPKTGIPILLGKDTQEFLNSKNGRRVLRGLAKNNDMDV